MPRLIELGADVNATLLSRPQFHLLTDPAFLQTVRGPIYPVILSSIPVLFWKAYPGPFLQSVEALCDAREGEAPAEPSCRAFRSDLIAWSISYPDFGPDIELWKLLRPRR